MALASVVQIESGVACPPWEATPYGVVSLLAMLEFSARDYVELTYQIGLMLGASDPKKVNTQIIGERLGNLLSEARRLGLPVTNEHLDALIREMLASNPHIDFDVDGTVRIGNMQVDAPRFFQQIESIYTILRAELGAILFRAIPRERVKYSNAEWLKSSPVQEKFPTSFSELNRAGTSYALGQSTASVFHSMRALEPALVALAQPFGNISTAHENWQTIIEQIERAVRELGKQEKSQQKMDDETFFGAATSHLYFVKNAWRNHVAHARDSYSDDEAVKILSRTLEFVESLCPRLQE
jgi:hypothetical protein